MSSNFARWLIHRANLLGLSWPDSVADQAGLSANGVASIAANSSLTGVGRSSRRVLARALKVSLRDLERFANGKLCWIEDDIRIDFDQLSPVLHQPSTRLAMPPISCPVGQGVPIVGRILESGRVEQLEDWSLDDRDRLPLRYVGLPDVFALETVADILGYIATQTLVFQPIAPGELSDCELALLTHAESVLCHVRKIDSVTLQLRVADAPCSEAKIVSSVDILRAAKVIDARPPRNRD